MSLEKEEIADRIKYLRAGIRCWELNRSGIVETHGQYVELKTELYLWRWKIDPESRYSLTTNLFGFVNRLAYPMRNYLVNDEVKTTEGLRTSRMSQVKHRVFTDEGLVEFDEYLRSRGRSL